MWNVRKLLTATYSCQQHGSRWFTILAARLDSRTGNDCWKLQLIMQYFVIYLKFGNHSKNISYAVVGEHRKYKIYSRACLHCSYSLNDTKRSSLAELIGCFHRFITFQLKHVLLDWVNVWLFGYRLLAPNVLVTPLNT